MISLASDNSFARCIIRCADRVVLPVVALARSCRSFDDAGDYVQSHEELSFRAWTLRLSFESEMARAIVSDRRFIESRFLSTLSNVSPIITKIINHTIHGRPIPTFLVRSLVILLDDIQRRFNFQNADDINNYRYRSMTVLTGEIRSD